MLTKYGRSVWSRYFVGLAIVAGASFFFISNSPVLYGVLLVLILVTAFVLNFFRDPKRTPPSGQNIIVSPADGKVVVVKEVFEPEFLKAEAVQVSVFMSPLDVHVNRFPLTGTVQYFRYVEGEFLVAFGDKSSERNERTHIGVEQGGFKVLFKQIAGAVARRIIAHVAVGQSVQIGEAFGMIQFGSRVDVLMPKGTQVLVKLNDRVVAGESVLARY